jgi:AcrR family transcriptional regulator
LKRKGAGYHHGDLRRALVEATLDLVAEHGTEGFTLRAAARLAGVSDGAPYHHFADKESLLTEVALEGYRALARDLEQAAAGATSEASRGHAMAVAYVAFAAAHPARFRLMFGPASEQRARHPELSLAARRVFGHLRRTLGAPTREPGASERALALCAWALVHGLALLAIDGHLGPAARTQRGLHRLAREALAPLRLAGAGRSPGARPAADGPPPLGRHVRAGRDRGGDASRTR